MEIKIGIQETPRELVIASSQTPDEVDAQVTAALDAKEQLLRLTDEKGRRYLVPTDQIAYVEIAPSDVRKVGFGVS